jgi:hypothetical protein
MNSKFCSLNSGFFFFFFFFLYNNLCVTKHIIHEGNLVNFPLELTVLTKS